MTTNTTKTFEEIMAEKTAQLEAAKAQAQQAIALARIDDKISRMEATLLADMKEDTTKALKQKLLMCEEVVNSMPIFSSKTRENRKWKDTSRLYGAGLHVELLTGLCRGIQYSTKQHKEQMLLVTGISEDLINDVVESCGAPAYYNETYNIIQEEVPYDYARLSKAIGVIGDRLDLTIDTNELTEARLAKLFESAKLNAETAQAKAELEQAKLELVVRANKSQQTINVEG